MICNPKRRLYADRLCQLNELGLPNPFEYGSVDNLTYVEQAGKIKVEQVGPDIENPIVDLRDGRTLYVVWLSLSAERPGLHLYDFRFELPWPDSKFEQLPRSTESCVGQAYILPDQLDYPREDILNFRFGKTGWRLPYSRVEGVLCALSDTPIPAEFKHGVSIPVRVKFFGESGEQLAEASVVLWADRWREPAVIRPSATPPIEADVGEPSNVELSQGSRLYAGPPPELTVCERSFAEYIRTRRPCGFRITWGEKGDTLSDTPVTFVAASPDPIRWPAGAIASRSQSPPISSSSSGLFPSEADGRRP
jgi:hypothetical protein